MNLTHKTLIAIVNLALVSTSQAIVFYDIDQATVSSNGVETVLTDSNTVYVPSGDADLISYRITTGVYAGTTLSVEDYISGVSATSSVVDVTGYIQPSGYLDSDFDFENSDPFYTGSSDPISYLSYGERGLSLSTALNVTTGDNQTIIKFDATIQDVSLLNDGIPDFLFGDAADNHSTDLIEFLDANGVAIVSVEYNTWSDLGQHKVDRILASGLGFNGSYSNDTNRGVALTAFEIGEEDLTEAGEAYDSFAIAMAEVTSIQISVSSESGSKDNLPKTDYAFLGFNLNALDSDAFVVPEPSAYAILLGLFAFSAAVVRRR
jgi:hypothetical protein